MDRYSSLAHQKYTTNRSQIFIEALPDLLTRAPGNDDNLTRQMTELHQAEAIGPDSTFLLTAYSAIPMGDAIRSMCEHLGTGMPTISYVLANRATREVIPEAKRFTREINRLATVVGNSRNVIILDQYTYTGATVRYAAQLLVAALAHVSDPAERQLFGVNGNWYIYLHSPEFDPFQQHYMDLPACSSKLPAVKAMMRDVGKIVAERM